MIYMQIWKNFGSGAIEDSNYQYSDFCFEKRFNGMESLWDNELYVCADDGFCYDADYDVVHWVETGEILATKIHAIPHLVFSFY